MLMSYALYNIDLTLVFLDVLLTFLQRLNDITLEGEITGDITVPGAPDEEDNELSTLDEPVRITVVSCSEDAAWSPVWILHILVCGACMVDMAFVSVAMTIMVLFQMRDLRAVGAKFFHVLYPKESKTLLRDCKCW